MNKRKEKVTEQIFNKYWLLKAIKMVLTVTIVKIQ